jgi:hypothetical protein
MFDLRRPDAEPEFFTEPGATFSHDGTVKSVVWVGEHTGVTAGEDGVIKYVSPLALQLTRGLMSGVFSVQVVGPPHTEPDYEHHVPWTYHINGALAAD